MTEEGYSSCRVSLIAGLEYGMERWNGKWNGTMNVANSCNWHFSSRLSYLLCLGLYLTAEAVGASPVCRHTSYLVM